MRRNRILPTPSGLVCMLLLVCSTYAAAQIPNQLNTGYPENGIFHGSDIDNLQINNGGLHVEIPIYSAKGRGLDVAAKVIYNSKSWTSHTRCFTSGGGFCEDDVEGDPLGYPTLSFFGAFDYAFSTSSSTCTTGGIPELSYTTMGGYTLREPDGTKHHFVPDPLIGLSACVPPKYTATLYADDGSGWIMHLNTGDGTIVEAINKNGTRVQPPSGSVGNRVAAVLIVDANGNQMSSSNICCATSGWGGTDTLGRTVPANGAYYDSTDKLQSPTFSGSVSVAIDTTPLCAFSTADTCVPDKNTETLPTQLNLPNGDVYTFTYAQNAGGELTSMTLPTGGQISWTWGAWDRGGRNVASRTVSANGVTGKWSYDYSQAPSVITVTDPATKDTRYTCLLTEDPAGFFSCGAVEKIEYFDGVAGSSPLLKTVKTDYNPYSIGGSPIPYYLPIRETTTWNQQNLVMKTETDWDTMTVSGIGTVNWRNPTEKRVFDWGSGAPGALLQRVHSSYRHLEVDGGSYLSLNIADLPTLVQTYDGAGNLVAQTSNSYDGSSLTSTGTCQLPGAPSHDYCNYSTSNLVRGNLTQVSRWINTSNTWVDTKNTYDDLGNFRSTSDPALHQTTFDYADSWGGSGCVTASSTLAFPTTVTNALGQRTKTSYYPCTSLVQSKRDENDIVGGRPGTTFTYDLMNRPLITETLGAGGQILARTVFGYNDAAIPLSITKTVTAAPDPDVVSTVYMDGLGRTAQTLLNDPEGNVTTEITYDAFGRKHSQTNPHRSIAAATDGTTQFAYDTLGRITDVIKQDGNTVHTDYAGNVTTVNDETLRKRKTKLDGLGRLVEVDEPGPGADSPGASGTGTINISGSTASFTSSGTKATGSFTVNGAEGVYFMPKHCVPDPNTGLEDCSGPSTTYDSGWVNVTVNGFTSSASYFSSSTAAGLASALAAGFNVAASPVSASYPGTGSTVTLMAKQPGPDYALSQSSSTNQGATFGGPSFSSTLSGTALTGGVFPVTTYDSGTLTVTVDGFTASAFYSQSLNNSSTTMAGSLASSLNAVASPVTASVSGSTITLTAKSVGIGTDYAVTGSSTASFTATGTTLGKGANPTGIYAPLITLYQYDALGNLLCVEQHGGVSGTGCSSPPSSDATSPWRVRRFTYDSLSRLLTANNPETGQTTYQYDNDSNLISKTDARGVTINYSPSAAPIDALHRVRMKTYSDGTPTMTYGYDQGCCGVNPQNGVGRLTYAVGGNTELVYVYDALGRVTSQADCPPSGIARGFCYSISANYDDAGQITSLTYPDGRVVSTGYNAAGSATGVNLASFNGTPVNFNYYTVPQTTSSTTWGYWPTGAMNRGTYGNGVIETTGYNNRLQVNSISDALNGAAFFSKTFGYYDASVHNNGDILSIADTLAATKNQTFTYDSLNRIVTGAQADNSFNLTFSYDPWGNMTESGTSNFPPGGFDGTNRVHQSTSCTPNLVSFCYDAAGDMLMDNHNHAFTYDGQARIKTVDGTAATYTYNPLGNRVRKDASATSTEYFFFGGNVIAELDPSTGAYTDYIFGYGKRIAKDTSSNGSAAQYYHDDQIGSARVMTDASGTKIMDCSFNPFGEQVLCSPDNASNHYRFSGKERDSESQLDDFDARYFSSSMGRWMTPDWSDRPTAVPYANFGDPQSLNLYLYVRNDPVSLGDAEGHVSNGAGTELCMLGIPGGCSTGASDTALMRQAIESGCGFWCHMKERLSNLFHGFGFLTNDGVEKMIHHDTLLLRSFGVNPEGMTDKQIMHKADKILADIDTAREFHSNYIIVNGAMFVFGTISKYPSSPTESPGPDWEWRGKGPVGSQQGSWYNPNTGESLHPDLNHADPIGPHYDYTDTNGNRFRYFPDGKLEPK